MTPGERAVGRVERVAASRRNGDGAPSRRRATSGTELASTDAVVRALAATDVFGGMGVGALRRLALLFDSVTVSGGELLMRQGDDADALYVVVTGRLQATHQGDDGQRALNDVVPPPTRSCATGRRNWPVDRGSCVRARHVSTWARGCRIASAQQAGSGREGHP